MHIPLPSRKRVCLPNSDSTALAGFGQIGGDGCDSEGDRLETANSDTIRFLIIERLAPVGVRSKRQDRMSVGVRMTEGTTRQVEFKGYRGGIEAIVSAEVQPTALESVLRSALTEAAGFLGKAALTVVLPGRRLDPELTEAVHRAFGSVEDLSVAALTTTPRQGRPPRARTSPIPHAGHAQVHRRTLRAGQELRHGGDLVVVGNVHRGASVIAEGDVIVLGRLEGMAHAGALGDRDRLIYAGTFAPTQVRIGDCIAVNPSLSAVHRRAPGATAQGPEWAHVEDQAIVVESWPSQSPTPRRARSRTA